MVSNEQLLFSHSAEFKGVEGKIVLTDVQVLFTPKSGNEATVRVPWGNIKKTQKNNPMKDKNNRVGFRVELEVGSPMSFFLVGGRMEVMAIEQTKLQSEASKILGARSAIVSARVPSPAVGISVGTKRSLAAANNSSVVNKTAEGLARNQLEERKKQLLEVDKGLGKNYRELVDTGVLDAEEFWATHMPDYAAQLTVDSSGSMQKGRLNSLKAANGKINMTAQDRRDILEAEPIVRLAYDELVPNQKSEREFWQLYCERTYFRHNTNRQAQEVFAGFEEKARRRKQGNGGADGGGVSLGDTSVTSNAVVEQAVASSKGTKFNILHNYADYDIPEKYDGEDNMASGSKELKRLNAESRMVITGNPKGLILSMGSAVPDSAQPLARGEVQELAQTAAPVYVPLKLKKLAAVEGKLEAETTTTVCSASAKSAFGKAKPSAFGKASSVGKPSTMGVSSASGGSSVNRQTKGAPRSAPEVLTSLVSSFPDSARSAACLMAERSLLRNQAFMTESMAHVEAMAKNGKDVAKLRTIDVSNALANSSLDDRFREEMLETYTGTVELLRHFYAILLRDGTGKPTQGSKSAEKIERLLERLASTRDKMRTKSRKFKDEGTVTGRRLDASLTVMEEVTKLVNRGEQWWQNYKERMH